MSLPDGCGDGGGHRVNPGSEGARNYEPVGWATEASRHSGDGCVWNAMHAQVTFRKQLLVALSVT